MSQTVQTFRGGQSGNGFFAGFRSFWVEYETAFPDVKACFGVILGSFWTVGKLYFIFFVYWAGISPIISN
ncbi:MAG: hypothetical protein ACYSOZ_00315, partial [Planctomycetota bacterium]